MAEFRTVFPFQEGWKSFAVSGLKWIINISKYFQDTRGSTWIKCWPVQGALAHKCWILAPMTRSAEDFWIAGALEKFSVGPKCFSEKNAYCKHIFNIMYTISLFKWKPMEFAASQWTKNFQWTSRKMRLQSTKSSKIRLHFLMATTCLQRNTGPKVTTRKITSPGPCFFNGLIYG